jgi:hypothetical protein
MVACKGASKKGVIPRSRRPCHSHVVRDWSSLANLAVYPRPRTQQVRFKAPLARQQCASPVGSQQQRGSSSPRTGLKSNGAAAQDDDGLVERLDTLAIRALDSTQWQEVQGVWRASRVFEKRTSQEKRASLRQRRVKMPLALPGVVEEGRNEPTEVPVGQAQAIAAQQAQVSSSYPSGCDLPNVPEAPRHNSTGLKSLFLLGSSSPGFSDLLCWPRLNHGAGARSYGVCPCK